MTNKIRCEWCLKDALYIAYHDTEWGVPEHDDHKLFELLLLEGAQAGLSWYTVLKKRENYRAAFDNFDPVKIANYDESKLQSLSVDAGIIRNKLKIKAAVSNAQAYLKVKEEFVNFDQYLWQFTEHQTLVHHPKSLREIPVKTKESDAMSKDLKQRGFRFVGSTICYAFMQAAGMVDDHIITCWRK